MSEKSEQKACVSKCIMDRDLEIAKRFSLEGWEGVVRLSKECLAFSKWVSSPACYLMKDDDDDCVEFLKIESGIFSIVEFVFQHKSSYHHHHHHHHQQQHGCCRSRHEQLSGRSQATRSVCVHVSGVLGGQLRPSPEERGRSLARRQSSALENLPVRDSSQARRKASRVLDRRREDGLPGNRALRVDLPQLQVQGVQQPVGLGPSS